MFVLNRLNVYSSYQKRLFICILFNSNFAARKHWVNVVNNFLTLKATRSINIFYCSIILDGHQGVLWRSGITLVDTSSETAATQHTQS